jgi:hypothetical protein
VARVLSTLLGPLEDHQRSIGFFDYVAKHEPKNRPGEGLTAASWFQRVGPAAGLSGLASTSIRVEFITRIYMNMLAEPADEIDPQAYEAADKLMSAYSADFQLGGEVMQVDLLGAYGEPLSARAGYLNQQGALYRVLDVITPLILDNHWSQSP